MREGLIESKRYPKYYHHPQIPRIVISEEGIVIDVLLDYCPLAYFNSHFGYNVMNIRGKGTMTHHRLVAETFHHKEHDHYVTNHIDGDKFNNRASNLEWVDRKRNLWHAYELGLKKDNRPVEVLDLTTQEVNSFLGLNKAAAWLKASQSRLHVYLNSTQQTPFLKKYNVRYADSSWKQIDSSNVGEKPNGAPREVVLTSKDGKEVYIFESYGEAARYFNVSTSSIWQSINRGTRVRGLFLAKHLDEKEGSVGTVVKRKPKKMSPNSRRPAFPIKVTNKLTGEVKHYASTLDFCAEVGARRNTVQRGMSINGGRWSIYQIEYVNVS
jgi:hypothetical protein